MKLSYLTSSIAFTICLLCAACGSDTTLMTAPTALPTSTLVAVVPNTGLFGNQQPTVVNKPKMELGAAYRYFDGSLLDAVPNDGPFLMGAVNSTGENPQHQVTVSSFWIQSTEVTNQMYAWCVSLGKCTPPDAGDNPTFRAVGMENSPVVGVTWQQAQDYCGFAHGRLPTEAEWEKAADWDGANHLQLLYPWGNQQARCDLLNFKYCVGHATSVVQYGQGRSFYGVYNLEGTVSEWVGDWYASDYYAHSAAQDPSGPTSGSVRGIRGSAYDSDAIYAAPVWRLSAVPATHRRDLGFRCVVQDPSYFAPFCTAPVSYGVTASGSSTQQCPAAGIQDLQGCGSANNPIDLVTVVGNSVATVTVSGMEGCTPSNNNLGVKHTCPSGVTITVNTSCGTSSGGAPSCPPNYRQDPQNPLQCTSPGAPGSCPAGFSYDSSLQCCSIPTGSHVPSAPCAVGQHLYNGACVLDTVGLQQPGTTIFTTGQFACVAGPNGQSVTATPRSPTATNPPTLLPPPTGTPLPTLVLPTSTPAPTNPPFPTQTPNPTQTPQAQPTDTPIPLPTLPLPTDTLAPLPTDTLIPPPISTSAPQPTATLGAGVPQLVTVPLYVPVRLSSDSMPLIYAIGGSPKR